MTQPFERLTDTNYWDEGWSKTRQGSLGLWHLDPSVRQIEQQLVCLVEQIGVTQRKLRILEVGCANSLWLPRLARRFDADVFGIDFSADGCAQARRQLERRAVGGSIWCQDFFQMADREHFDLIISFGFIEHFDRPHLVLEKMQQLLSPGGRIYATIPNIGGIYGSLQSFINKDVLDVHQAMDSQELRRQAELAGLSSIETGYVGGMVYFGVLNFQTGKQHRSFTRWNNVRRVLRAVDLGAGLVLEAVGANRNQPLGSPYVYLAGAKARPQPASPV